MQHIVILGGGYAGLLAALRLQKHAQNGNAKITLINASDRFTERIRLHQVAAGQQLRQYMIPTLLHGTGIQFVQAWITNIQPQQQRINIQVDGTEQAIDYDKLLVALGSHVDKDAISGIREHTYTCDAKSALALREKLQHGGRLLVIGGGLTAIEAAAEFAEQENVEVHLVSRSQVGSELSRKGRNAILQTLTKMGVTVHEHVRVTAIENGQALSDMGVFPFDACLWAGGFKANPLVAQAGFSINQQGQMLVTETLQARDYPNVIGIGDAASVIMHNGATLRMACAVAMPMGAHGADVIDALLTAKIPNPFAFAYALQCISLGRRNGLVQLVTGDDSPKEQIISGRAGAIIKEIICRYTTFSLQLEKRFPGIYRYPRSIQASPPNLPQLVNSVGD